MRPLSQSIRECRESARLSKAELARRIGVSDVAVGYWESGEINVIGHVHIQSLARVFGITVSELLGDEALPRLIAERQAEVLYEFTHGSHIMPAALNLAMCKRAKELRRQAEGCPDPGQREAFDKRVLTR